MLILVLLSLTLPLFSVQWKSQRRKIVGRNVLFQILCSKAESIVSVRLIVDNGLGTSVTS